jgi:hypothetical protein
MSSFSVLESWWQKREDIVREIMGQVKKVGKGKKKLGISSFGRQEMRRV